MRQCPSLHEIRRTDPEPVSLDRPFLRADAPHAGRSPSPISHFQPIQRSKTTPLPDPPPESTDFDCTFPPFPLPRTKSLPRTGVAEKSASSAPPPLPSQGHPGLPQVKTTLPFSPIAPIPPPKSDDEPYTISDKRHQREFSIDSKSSYRTSFASTRYGDSRMSTTTSSSLHPSMASASRGNPFLDDVPPLPSAPASFSHSRQDSSISGLSLGEYHNGLHFGISNDSNSYRDEIENSGYSPFRDSTQPPSSRGSEEFFARLPSSHPASHGHSDLPDLPEERSPSPHSWNHQFEPYRSSNHLHPPGQEGESYDQNDRMRKNSDANSEISVSNFARALGLDHAESTAESSIASSDISPSDTRSGTSMSSLPSEASLSRRKPSDMSRLGPVFEEQPDQAPFLDDRVQTASPTPLEPPRAPGPLFSPDSPTDPAIFHGSLSLIPDTGSKRSPHDAAASPESSEEQPGPVARSATAPLPKPAPRPKGRCRGCGEMIMGKSVSSADGRLTGRYHRSCFVCCYCRVPFETADFYVLDDKPYCAPHYHELNGSLCSTCDTGIEGQYLETLERRGRGITDRQKFHPECLRCRACRVVLKGDYFEWNGQVFCERDAFRAASAPVSPNRPRRPTLPSPLSQPHHYPPRSPDYGPGPGYRPGLRPLGPPGPYGYQPYGPPFPGPRRFPERRTTRLMMT